MPSEESTDRTQQDSYAAFVPAPWWMYVAVLVAGAVTILLTAGSL